MGTYAGDSSQYNPTIFVFEESTLVLGGPDGPDNVALKELADSGAYLKKFKGRIVRGVGAPNASTLAGFHADGDVVNNTLYLDESTQSFWKPNDSTGSTWTNKTKTAKLNIKGLSLNDAGNDTNYMKLEFDAANNRLVVKNSNDTLGNLQVGKLIFNQIDGQPLESAKIVDDEILLLYEITSEAQNQNAQFVVKRLDDLPGLTVIGWNNTAPDSRFLLNTSPVGLIAVNDYVQIRGLPEATGENIDGYYLVKAVAANYIDVYENYKKIVAVATSQSSLSGQISKDNSAMIMWNEASMFWELRDRAGNLLSINVGGLYINGVLSEIIPDRVIRNTLDYLDVFAHVETGSDTCYLKKPETNYTQYIQDEWIIVRPNADTPDGSYGVDNNIEIAKSNVKLEFYPGASFKFNGNYTFRVRNDSDAGIYRYSPLSARIYSESTYRTEGEFQGNQISPLAGDELFTYSATPLVNRERAIVTIKKLFEENLGLKPDTRVALDTALSSGAQTVSADKTSLVRYRQGGVEKIGFSYINNGQIYFSILSFNSTTKQYEQVYPATPMPIYGSSVSPARSFSNVWVAKNGTRFFVFAYDNAANVVRCAYSNDLSDSPLWTTQSSSFQLLDGTGASLTNFSEFKFIVDSDVAETIHGVLWKSSTKALLVTKGTMNFTFGLYTPVANGYSTASPAITGVETKDFDTLDYDGINILLSYCKLSGGVKKLFLARITKSSGVIGSQPATFSSPIGANLYGEITRLLKTSDGNLYCFFTETVSPYNKNNVLYSRLDFTVSATWLSVGNQNLQIPGVNNPEAVYDSIDAIYNDLNRYPSDGYPFYELVLSSVSNTGTQNSTEYLRYPVEQFTPGNDRLKITGHTFRAGDIVYLTTGGTLPVGLAPNTPYYVLIVNSNFIQLSLTPGGSAINFTTSGTGAAVIHVNESAISSWNDSSDYVVFTPGQPGLQVGDKVRFKTDGAFPTTTPQIDDQTDYFVTSLASATEITISDTYGGPTIDIGTGATGNHWIRRIALSISENPPGMPDDIANTFFHTGHGLVGNDQVYFQEIGGGTLPAGLEQGRVYYVVAAGANTFKVSETQGGPAFDFTDPGTSPFVLYKIIPGTFSFTESISKICTYLDFNAVTAPRLDNVSNWNVATITVSLPFLTHGIKTKIAQRHNDYLFVHYIDTTDFNKNYMAKLYHAFDILFDIPIEVQDLVDMVASDNAVRNLDLVVFLKAKGTGTGGSFTDKMFRAGNNVKSRLNIRIERAYGDVGADFQHKSFGLDVTINVDESNVLDTGVKELNHSFGFVDVTNTGTKSFDTCRNVALQGFINGDAVVVAAPVLDE